MSSPHGVLTQPFSVRLTATQNRRLTQLAHARHRTRAGYVRLLIIRHLDDEAGQSRRGKK